MHVEESQDAIGEVLGGYRLREIIGEGGMGRVYRGAHVSLGQEAAVKVLSSARAADPSAVTRFFREANAVASLRHPNIVEILDYVESDSPRRFAYVMELLEGLALNEALDQGPLTVVQAMNIGLQLTDVLAAIHAIAVVHRDLKPENVILTDLQDPRGRNLSDRPTIKLIDFGVAKIGDLPNLTRTGAMLGTPAYMAPEQVALEPVSPATDIYALGEILFEMVTGRRAFPKDDVAATLLAKLAGEPPALHISPRVPCARRILALVRWCLAPRPKDRPQLLEVERSIREILEEQMQGTEAVTLAGDRPESARDTEPRAIGSMIQPARACLWNVVAHVEKRAHKEGQLFAETHAETIRKLLRHLSAHPLILRTEADDKATPQLAHAEDGAIVARGPGEDYLPALVRALVVPQVPTSVVFAGAPPIDNPITDELVHLADRVVTFADRSTLKAPLRRIQALAAEMPLGPIDLGWLAMAPLRQLVASLFDPPATSDDVARIERVMLWASPKHRWSCHLLLAWICGALEAHTPKKLGERAWRFERRAGKVVDLILEELDEAAWPVIELSAPSIKAKYSVRPLDASTAVVCSPHDTSERSLPEIDPAVLLARALASRSEDRAFARALQIAGGM